MNDPKAIIYGEVLERLRRKKRMTQEELAFESSLDRTTIGRIERGKLIPSLTTLFALASGLKMHGWEIVKEIEEQLEKRQQKPKGNRP